MNKKMRILVTGGAGFLGSHLCERLIEEGNKVICLDNLFTGRLYNIHHLLTHRDFKFIPHDVTDPLDIEVDQIFHFACPASPVHYQANPIKTLKTSVIGSLNMLELARKYNAKILLASTSEVYGNPLIHPQSESYLGNVSPIGPRACYDEGKRCAETLFFDYHRFHGVNIRVVRIFNTYGPRMNEKDGRVVSNFIVQALENKGISVYGDGLQTRSFCYVDDLIEGILRMMDVPDDFVGPVNLGNPNELTIKETATRIISMCNSNSNLTFFPLPIDDPIKRRPDITLAKERLNWEPTIAFEDGLKKTIEYFKVVLKEGNNDEST